MIKRALDIALSLTGLLLLSPLLFLVSVVVKLWDFGPVFYVAERVGRGGRAFAMYKFRTMVVRADKLGASITVGGDSRITPVGLVLRKFKLDEFPQLWNVVRGEMSLVGPRPEVREYVNRYSAEQCRVLELTPGITDLASFAFYDESDLLARASDPERFYREQLVPEKIRINMAYAEKASVLTDVILIAATVARAAGIKLDLFGWFKIDPPRAAVPA